MHYSSTIKTWYLYLI